MDAILRVPRLIAYVLLGPIRDDGYISIVERCVSERGFVIETEVERVRPVEGTLTVRVIRAILSLIACRGKARDTFPVSANDYLDGAADRPTVGSYRAHAIEALGAARDLRLPLLVPDGSGGWLGHRVPLIEIAHAGDGGSGVPPHDYLFLGRFPPGERVRVRFHRHLIAVDGDVVVPQDLFARLSRHHGPMRYPIASVLCVLFLAFLRTPGKERYTIPHERLVRALRLGPMARETRTRAHETVMEAVRAAAAIGMLAAYACDGESWTFIMPAEVAAPVPAVDHGGFAV